MKTSTKLTSKGQVVIPKPVRDRLRWRTGTRLEVEALADGTLRIPVQATYELAQAPEALGALTAQHTQGKLAIRVH